ncbi:MAG: hypothetical protein APF81_05815 [Desulfosporosinus sp. BRH_c37]|nr:MAG: hypothetical protein APF81_05815 [Desulfosporosinus sp. BRH_c37]
MSQVWRATLVKASLRVSRLLWEGAGAWNGDGEVAKHSVSHMVVGQTKAEELDENGRGTSFDFSGGTKGRK